MQKLENKNWTFKKAFKSAFKHYPRFNKDKPNQAPLIVMIQAFRLIMSFTAIGVLFFIDFLPGKVGSHPSVSLFIFAIVTLNIGFFIHKDIADRCFNKHGINWIFYMFFASVSFPFAVAINNSFGFIFWLLLPFHFIAAIQSLIVPFLPPILEPLETQEFKARQLIFHILDLKKNNITEDEAEKHWQTYQKDVRSDADFVNPNIPAQECFDDLSQEERNAIVHFCSFVLAARSVQC